MYMKKIFMWSSIFVFGFVSINSVLAQEMSGPIGGGVTCPGWGQTGGSCHETVSRYTYTAYGWAICDYCEWTGIQDNYCNPMSHGGCMTA